MSLLELLTHIGTTILVGHLALVNTITAPIDAWLHKTLSDTLEAPQEEYVPTPPAAQPSTEITLLSQSLAGSSTIPNVLIINPEFQAAALAARNSANANATRGEDVISPTAITDALVNILCQYKTQEYTRTTTGTGFFIDDSGVLLTNAHVAQFLLLETVDDSVIDANCVIRTGTPATASYSAELLFISPTWILNNARLITEEAPRGTGEFDYALLYISKSMDNSTLPNTFPALPIHTELLTNSTTGTRVFSAGYPAEKLLREGPRAKLYPKVASTTIGELYTFGSNYADIFDVSASSVGEQGSSGGPVVHPSLGTLGLIVTKGDEDIKNQTSTLRALTVSYIDRTITKETGFSLIQNTQGDLAYRGSIFKNALAPFLASLLEDRITAKP